MTIESSRMQMPTSSPNPLMNVQHQIQKGLNENDKNPSAVGNANKQAVAGLSVPQKQNVANEATNQISKGYLDIKI
jgi:ABC-type glutathione transport system ATPase component